MLRKEIKHNDYEGNPTTTVAYFHLNKFEWLELETFTKGGLVENLKHALETNNAKKTIGILQKIILTAYGEKNEETGAFEKNDVAAIKFSKTEAFSELFYELAYDDTAAGEFFMSLVPAGIKSDVQERMSATRLPEVRSESDR